MSGSPCLLRLATRRTTPGQLKAALQKKLGATSAMRRQILQVAYQSSSAHPHAWDKVVASIRTKAALLDISSHSECGSWIDDILRSAKHQLPNQLAALPTSSSEVGRLMHQPEQAGGGQRDGGCQLENAGAKALSKEGKQKTQEQKQWHHCQRLSVY